MRNRHYLNWVRRQPCIICETDKNIDPHHILGTKTGGWNVKSSDFTCVPLCRHHHDELHIDPVFFEESNGITQWEMSTKTLLRAIHQGVLEVTRG